MKKTTARILRGAVCTAALAALLLSCEPTASDSGSSASAQESETTTSGTTTTTSATSGDISASYVNTKYASGTTDSRSGQTAWKMANCHDPKLFQDDDGTYYVYATDASCGNIGKVGIHIRYSTDLVNWTGLATSALAGHWDEDFLAWEGFTASSSETVQNNSAYTAVTWAPTVIKQNGLYYMFHGVNADVAYSSDNSSGTSWASSIVLAIGASAKGPFYPASYISQYSGSDSTVQGIKSKLEGLGVSYSQNFLVRYSAMSGKTRTAKSSLDGSEIDNPDYSLSDNGRFGCIDPEFVYDVATGNLMSYTIGDNTCYAMIYGSWLYGISLIYVDAESLKPVYKDYAGNGISSVTVDGTTYTEGMELECPLDKANYEYYGEAHKGNYGCLGTRIAGGYGAGYEGAQLFYNSDTNYYYLITSCGGLDYEYRCTLGRSESIEGPYYDAGGQSMLLTSDTASSYHAIGSKIIGSYELSGEYSFRCQGGLSIYRDQAGKILFANHSRTNFSEGYYFYLQIHQMFFNEDGWPVLNQNEYYEDKKFSEKLAPLAVADIAGNYDTILTVRGSDAKDYKPFGQGDPVTVVAADGIPTESKLVSLSADGKVSGAYVL